MIKTISTLLGICLCFSAMAQDSTRHRGWCGTPEPTLSVAIPPEAFLRFQQQKANTPPICVRVAFVVFANDDGTQRAASDANILWHLRKMAGHYAPHNICFALHSIRQVNNTDLNDHYKNEEAELLPFRVTNCLTVFIHDDLQPSPPKPGTILLGTAYDVPNLQAYVSLRGEVIQNFGYVTLSHEVGHVFGLHHTFAYGSKRSKELVNRSGSCKNCENISGEVHTGDELCDTPADPDQDEDFYLKNHTNANCLYTGTLTDGCAIPYVPLTNNIMSYGRDECTTQFTTGQGIRMLVFLATIPAFAAYFVPATAAIPAAPNWFVTISVGIAGQQARDELTVSQSGTYLVNGTATHTLQAKRVVLKPGTRFSPDVNGQVLVTTENPYCTNP